MRRWLIAYLSLALAVLAIPFALLWEFGAFADMGLSKDGVVALALMLGLGALFGVGLMALVFYSGRSGHDERVADPEEIERMRHRLQRGHDHRSGRPRR